MGKIILALIALLPSLVFGSTYSQPYAVSNATITTGGQTDWILTCDLGVIIYKIEEIWLDATSVTLPNVDFILDGVTLYSTTSVPSAGSGRPYSIDFNNYVCDGKEKIFTIDITNSGTLNQRKTIAGGSTAGVINSFVDLSLSTTTYDEKMSGIVYYVYPLGGGGGGGGGSNIYIGDTISGMVSEWECTTSGDTTNCEAISTSSVGIYNGPNFYEWLFVAGILVFLISFSFWGKISFTKPKT